MNKKDMQSTVDVNGRGMAVFPKPPKLPIPDAARSIHRHIICRIKDLLAGDVSSPLDPLFMRGYREVLDLFEKYQREVIRHSGFRLTCSKGCMRCCCHWVEDVYCFEAEIIADFIRRTAGDRVGEIVEKFREDIAEMTRLDAIVARKLAEHAGASGAGDIDQVDLLLACFYQMGRPCALLGPDAACGIYPVRPITCRIYVSFSDPAFCDPDYINIADVRTYLLDFEEEASELLDRLHLKYDRFGSDTGLRSVLVKCLTQ